MGAPSATMCSLPAGRAIHHRLRYQTFDMAPLLKQGPNAIGAILGDGWFRGRLGYGGGREQHLRGSAGAARTAGDRVRRRHYRSGRHGRRPGAPPPARSSQAASTTARPMTPGWRVLAGRQPGFDDRRLGGRGNSRARSDARWSRRAGHPCGGSSSWRRWPSARRPPAAPSSTSARTWSAGCA